MKIKATDYLRFLYFVLLGALLILLAAVNEQGETELSRTLIPRFSEVPEMIEAIIAGVTLTTAGGLGASYIEREKTESR